MKELKGVIKKGGLMALGLALVTKEEAEKVAKKLLVKGKANEPAVKKLAVKILMEAKANQRKMKKDAIKVMEGMQKKCAKVMCPECAKPKKKKPVKKKTMKK